MKAIAKTKPIRGAELIDIPKPVPTGNEVLIKVEYSAICGGDIHLYNWTESAAKSIPAETQWPFVLGHEIAGTVVEVGANVSESRIGQRVTYETHPYCGECYQCRIGNRHICLNMGRYNKYRVGAACGGFAQYKLSPENLLFTLPDNISFEQAALYEPGGVAMYAFEESNMNPGDTVVIYGCGPIGLMAMQIYKACGAGKVIGIDVNEYRLNMAKKYADIVINGKSEPALEIVRESTKEHGGADVIVEATAYPGIYETMFEMARPGACIIIVGLPDLEIPINVGKYIGIKNLVIKGHFGRSIWSSWDKLNALEACGRINLLETVTHRFALEEYEKAFEVSMGNSGKVLFKHS